MSVHKLAVILFAALAPISCEDGIQLDLNEKEQSYQKYFDATIDPSKICSDITVAKTNGGVIKGARDCQIPKEAVCAEPGATGCYLTDPSFYGLAPSDHVAENFRKDVTIADVTGDQIANDSYCSQDGEDSCVATAERPSVTNAGAAAKVAIGHDILGVAGTFAPDFPEAANVMDSAQTGGSQGTLPHCTATRTTNCVLTPAYRAVAPSALVSSDIKSGEVIGSVTGNFMTTLPNCSASNRTDCIATSRFAAVERSRVRADNIETGYNVLGVGGSVQPLPGNCTGDNQTGCVATGPYKAIEKANIDPGLLRQGVTLAGVAGDYPSASYPLAGADSGVADLKAGSFASQVASSASFELWDSAGQHYQLQGSSSLVPERIVSGATIFGVAGNLSTRPANCASDGQDGCVAHAGFPAIRKADVTPGILRRGVILAGVTGDYPSASHRLAANTARADLSFPADLASTNAVEFFDATGALHTVTGSADLAGANILSGISLFGVNGSAIATPGDCAGHDEQNCVARSAFPAYRKTSLSAGIIKKGVIISGTTGTFPSATSPLIGASGTHDLTAGDFVARLSSGAEFEFWDATGLRQRVTGNAGLTGANILSGVTIFGLVGSLKNQPPPCGLATQNCLTTTSYPSYDPSVLTEAVVKSGFTLGEVSGRYPSASYPLPSASAAVDLTVSNFNARMASPQVFEYWTSTGQRFSAAGDADLTSAHLRQGQTLFGVTGTALSSSANCASENATGCVTTTGFPAFESARLAATNIKAGTTVLGVTGTYPSAANRLAGATATTDLSAASFDSAMASSASVEFFTSAGAQQTVSGSSDLIPANIIQGTTIYNVVGNIAPTPANCATRNQQGCMATASLPAFEKSTLIPGVLKSGVSLYGVTGDYPSASFPLANATSTPDLDGATFAARHQSSATFEYFDSAGNRHTGSGDDDLQPSNISQGVTILGVAGSFLGTSSDIAWDIVHGESVAGIAGRVKPNCRNMADYGFYQGSGIYDNIDDENLTRRDVYPQDNPWGNTDGFCEADVFQDVSYNTSTNQPTTCVDHRSDIACMHKDRISGLTWHQAIPGGSSGLSWSGADNHCRNLSVAGHSDWRLPTQDEAIAAHVNGIHRLKVLFNKVDFSGDEMGQTYRINYDTWTSKDYNGQSTHKVTVKMAQGHVGNRTVGTNTFFHCVRQD